MGNCCGKEQQQSDDENDFTAQPLLDDDKSSLEDLESIYNDPGFPGIILQRSRALENLTILSSSGNADVQRRAAVAFFEASQQQPDVIVSEECFEALHNLCKSTDKTTLRMVSGCLSNITYVDENKRRVVNAGLVSDVIAMADNDDAEVQAQAAGVITNLSTLPELKRVLCTCPGCLSRLAALLKSGDVRVLHNVAGALFNFTHVEENRRLIVLEGLVPSLVSLIHHTDQDIQFYSVAALSNLAIEKAHRQVLERDIPTLVSLLKNCTASVVSMYASRAAMKASQDQEKDSANSSLGPSDSLLASQEVRLLTQLCLALRNLSCDEGPRTSMIKQGVLRPLITVLLSTPDDTLTQADVSTSDKCSCLSHEEAWPCSRKGFVGRKVPLPVVPRVKARIDTAVRASVLSLIRNLCFRADVASNILETGLLEMLACLLWDWKENGPELLATACTCVRYLAANEANHDYLSKAGLVCPVIRLVVYGAHCPCNMSEVAGKDTTDFARSENVRLEAISVISFLANCQSTRWKLLEHSKIPVHCITHNTSYDFSLLTALLTSSVAITSGNSQALHTRSAEAIVRLCAEPAVHETMSAHTSTLLQWVSDSAKSAETDAVAMVTHAATAFKILAHSTDVVRLRVTQDKDLILGLLALVPLAKPAIAELILSGVVGLVLEGSNSSMRIQLLSAAQVVDRVSVLQKLDTLSPACYELVKQFVQATATGGEV